MYAVCGLNKLLLPSGTGSTGCLMHQPKYVRYTPLQLQRLAAVLMDHSASAGGMLHSLNTGGCLPYLQWPLHALLLGLLLCLALLLLGGFCCQITRQGAQLHGAWGGHRAAGRAIQTEMQFVAVNCRHLKKGTWKQP